MSKKNSSRHVSTSPCIKPTRPTALRLPDWWQATMRRRQYPLHPPLRPSAVSPSRSVGHSDIPFISSPPIATPSTMCGESPSAAAIVIEACLCWRLASGKVETPPLPALPLRERQPISNRPLAGAFTPSPRRNVRRNLQAARCPASSCASGFQVGCQCGRQLAFRESGMVFLDRAWPKSRLAKPKESRINFLTRLRIGAYTARRLTKSN